MSYPNTYPMPDIDDMPLPEIDIDDYEIDEDMDGNRNVNTSTDNNRNVNAIHYNNYNTNNKYHLHSHANDIDCTNHNVNDNHHRHSHTNNNTTIKQLTPDNDSDDYYDEYHRPHRSHDDIVKLIQSYYHTHEHVRKIDSHSSIFIDGYVNYVDGADYSSDEDNEFEPLELDINTDEQLYSYHQYFYIKYNRQLNVLKRLIFEYVDMKEFNPATSLTIVFMVEKQHSSYNHRLLYNTAFWLNELFATITNPDINNDIKRVEFSKIFCQCPYCHEPIPERFEHIRIKCCDSKGEFFDATHDYN